MDLGNTWSILLERQQQILKCFLQAHVRETRRRQEWNIAGWLSEFHFPSNQIPAPSNPSIPVKMAFIISPYDQVLDLTDKSHLKLFTDERKGLPTEVKFNGTR